MQIEYCDACQRRITEHDLQVGQAAWFDDRILCKKCLEAQGLKAPAPQLLNVARKAGDSAILAALSGSGVQRVVPSGGSGIHAGSKLRSAGSKLYKPPTSKIRKGPGSGIRSAAAGKPSSGLRAGSGLRPASGIRAAAGKPRLASSSVLKAQGGSGVRQAAASKLRAVGQSSGTLRAQPRSGILTASSADGRKTPRSGLRRRKGRARAKGENGDMVLSIVTAVLTLLAAIGLFLLLKGR